jgi:integrase
MKALMTWVENRKGWMKGYKGKMYSVSCKQLNCLPTKADSLPAANLWWSARQVEIDRASRPPEADAQAAVEALLNALPVASEGTTEARQRHRAALYALNLSTIPENQRIATEMEFPGTAKRMAAALKPKTPTKTVCRAAEGWLGVVKHTVAVDTYDRYRRIARHVAGFIGSDADVSAINSEAVKAFMGHLAEQVASGTWSQRTAGEYRMVFRMFVRDLAEEDAIVLPKNLNNRRLSKLATNGKGGHKPIVTFTPDELRTILTAVPEKTQLYALLGLNCGMEIRDIAALGADEIDWKAGTITRRRTKYQHDTTAPKVTYKLWQPTLTLLERHRADHLSVLNALGQPRLLLSTTGKPLRESREEGDRFRRKNLIASAWEKVRLVTGINKSHNKLRKTSFTTLAEHPEFRGYVRHFRAAKPTNDEERSYVIPSQERFDAAVLWLGVKLLGEGNQP